jgi:hypothetical protein
MSESLYEFENTEVELLFHLTIEDGAASVYLRT